MVLLVNCFRNFEIYSSCIVIAIWDLVQGVNAIRGLCKLRIASGNISSSENMGDSSETANFSFTGILYLRKYFSRCC